MSPDSESELWIIKVSKVPFMISKFNWLKQARHEMFEVVSRLWWGTKKPQGRIFRDTSVSRLAFQNAPPHPISFLLRTYAMSRVMTNML
jgi:hypothetical protein